MSRREEIRQKEQLQLQLQAQFSKLDQTVMSWLIPNSNLNSNSNEKSTSISSSEFGNQIVIPTGKGINFDDNKIGNDGKEINLNTVTIDDFLDNVSMKKNKKNGVNDFKSGRINKIGDIKKRDNGTSNSLRALTHKLRTDRREHSKNNISTNKYNNNNNNNSNNNNKKIGVVRKQNFKNTNDTTHDDNEDDSESDDEILNRKSKTTKTAKSNKNKRPF
ncbi:hypothetical protein C6P42_004588 [Pichia californica]|nr:hypothetical protein C6P42_004588 [[Candida] californica]